jgi:hypothetical protein
VALVEGPDIAHHALLHGISSPPTFGATGASRPMRRSSSEKEEHRMKRLLALGAAALLALGLHASASVAASATPTGPSDPGVCPAEGKVEVPGEQASVTITAPAGMVITGYCVKAGSAKQGDGPMYVTLDEPATTVTITHVSGKAISHYSVIYEPTPTPSS